MNGLKPHYYHKNLNLKLWLELPLEEYMANLTTITLKSLEFDDMSVELPLLTDTNLKKDKFDPIGQKYVIYNDKKLYLKHFVGEGYLFYKRHRSRNLQDKLQLLSQIAYHEANYKQKEYVTELQAFNDRLCETKHEEHEIIDNLCQKMESLLNDYESLDVKRLNLSNNDLTEIPIGICKMKNLKTLILDNNRLKQIPSDLFEMSLERLYIRNNPFQLKFPNDLSNLKSLKFMSLTGTSVFDAERIKRELPNCEIIIGY